MISKKINLDKTEEYIWLQCENEKCMKWRKVKRCLSYNYENLVWFCSMSLDVNYNDCCKPQEKISVPRGETLICSELCIGELVWAKMPGYPRWPAIITADPVEENGAHIDRYQDGTDDPHFYHVEFLGKPRSHAWILARCIDKYSISSTDLLLDAKIKESKKIKDRLQYANQEAALMLSLSPKKRIHSTVYKYQLTNTKKSMVIQKDNKNSKKKKVRNSGEKCQCDTSNSFDNEIIKRKKTTRFNPKDKCIQDEKKKKEIKSDSDTIFINLNGRVFPLIVDKNKLVSQLVENNVTNNGTNSVLDSIKYSTKENLIDGKMKKKLKNKNVCSKSDGMCDGISDEVISDGLIMKCDATELQLYKKHPHNDEETFWRTYKFFISDKKKIKISTNVTWYNCSVSLFKLYQRVHLIGGYRKATSHWKIWRNICWDLLDTKLDSKFLTIRKAYRKLLLPFEKYQKFSSKKIKKADINKLLATHALHSTLTYDNLVENLGKLGNQQFANRNLYTMPFNKSLQVVPHSPFDINSLPTSNPNSPSLLSYGSCSNPVKNPSIIYKMSKEISNDFNFSILSTDNTCLPIVSDITVEDVFHELNCLESHLNDLNVFQDLFADQSVPQNDFIKDNACANEEILLTTFNGYDPIIGSQNVEGLNDVICELNELEDTLLELAAEIMSGGNNLAI